MKILKLHIENFGKLSNLSMDFESNFISINEKNGWGKTTLSIFLKAMFYSMPQKGNNKAYKAERSKYKPWQGGVYGGFIDFAVNNKSYRLTRTFADTPEGDTFELLDLKTGLVSKDYSKNIGYELFGCGVETFQITAFFPQMALQSGMTDEMRANMSGLNKFENDLGALKDAEKNITTKLKKIKSDKPKQVEIEQLKEYLLQLENKINSSKNEILALDKNILENEKKWQELKKQNIVFEQNKKEKIIKEQNIKNEEKILLNLQAQLSESLTEQLSQSHEQKIGVPNKSNKSLIITISSCLLFAFLVVVLGALNIFSWIVSLSIIGTVLLIGIGAVLFSLRKNDHKSDDEKKYPKEDLNIQILRENIKKQEKYICQLKSELQNVDDNMDYNGEIYQIEKVIAVSKSEKNAKEKDVEYYLTELTKTSRSLQEKEQFLNDSKYKITILEKTLEFMQKAKQNVSTRFMQPMKKAFDTILGKIDKEKKDKISMDIDFNLSEISPSGNKELEFMSQGYKDLLSICQRLALLDDVFKEEKPFIVLDDPCVNLDDEKARLLKEVLKEFSQNYQIIYLYCHSRNGI